jgi:hypothetical protein
VNDVAPCRGQGRVQTAQHETAQHNTAQHIQTDQSVIFTKHAIDARAQLHPTAAVSSVQPCRAHTELTRAQSRQQSSAHTPPLLPDRPGQCSLHCTVCHSQCRDGYKESSAWFLHVVPALQQNVVNISVCSNTNITLAIVLNVTWLRK